MKILAIFVAAFCFFILVISQSTDTSTTPASTNNTENNLNPDWSYCFEFTWVGPAYDNITRFNTTCADYLDTTRAKGVPCSPPIVITYDSTPPDIDYLYNNHMASVLCKRTPDQVCASYTYSFDGTVSNATYMCTKVIEVDGGALTTGCYKQKVGGYNVELCLCKSNPGLYKPCNGGLVTYI